MALPLDPGFKPVLIEGNYDLAVRAAQVALTRALKARGIVPRNLMNGAYGSLTVKDVARFERAVGMTTVRGTEIGPETWRHLTPYLRTTEKRWLARRRIAVTAKRAKQRARARALAARLNDPRKRLMRSAKKIWSYRARYRYTWTRPFNYNEAKAWTYDCSGTVSTVYEDAGVEDPNGLDHNGFGYTGTLWPRGRATSDPKPGDLAFYGYDDRGPFPSHVAMVIDRDTAAEMVRGTQWEYVLRTPGLMVLSYGSDPMRVAPLRYRSDYRGCRSYL